MRIIVMTSRYPSKDSPYSHMFVHTRNKEYLSQGHQILVLVPAKKHEHYQIEGVKVVLDNVESLSRHLANADRVMIHLLYHRFDRETDADTLYKRVLAERLPTMFFLHGVETQTIWNSRREDINWTSPATIARWLYRDFYLIKRMRQTLIMFSEDAVPCKFITPSKWMLKEAVRHTKVKLDHKSLVIPNGIDTEHFKFKQQWQHREQLLSIRPLAYRGKYAVDLLLEVMSLRKENESLTLYGKGEDEALINEVANASIHSAHFQLNAEFLNHFEIPAIHANHGVYLAVTRMDAQGVSMCEAMASGLPTISFNTCAIPEFIKHQNTGFLAEAYDTTQFSNYIDELVENRRLFESVAENARAAMEEIDIRKTTALELDEKL